MILKSLSPLLFLAALSQLVNSTPLERAVEPPAAASAHNIYLVTCETRCSRRRCGPDRESTFTAVAYFRQPIGNNTNNPTPNRSAAVSDPASPWEGVNWKVKVWRGKVFESTITAGANALAKGQIAGDTKLDDEDFVCFKDGETVVVLRDEGRDGERDGDRDKGQDQERRAVCRADYWCPSVSVGKAGVDD
ncbi:hypothetical protein K469DRAFT_687603 [Zopfia rhizophila CBS 207.26]|uniref:Uncharacterized protein n=1 Tax=Zopfia rhizophila CBS 207.26 TaxID=1314779 RepID=A0A6A6E5G1_9PEZI|nr:hypothetical protein K469DRAFT_687603 [Zopfia rhizophila CBS 207.26]